MDDLGDQALERFLAYQDARTVLDVGAGWCEQARVMREAGREVTTVGLHPPADVVGDYLQAEFAEPFDGIWCCHVLEHILDVQRFLRKLFLDLREDGVLAITVPPAKNAIVGGHVSLWNAGLLIYRLVLAGFDCSYAMVGTYGYNVSVIVRKRAAELPPVLMDGGDIGLLAKFFPVPVAEGFDGQLPNIRWG